MDFVNFGTFETRSPLLTSDFLVGYKTTGPTEIKTQVKDIIDLINDSDSQTLSFDENSKNLSISSGNTVSLSAFVESDNTAVPAATAINNILVLSQVTYDGIAIKDPKTLYYIV